MFVNAVVRRKSLFTFACHPGVGILLTPGCGLGLMRIGYASFAVKTENGRSSCLGWQNKIISIVQFP